MERVCRTCKGKFSRKTVKAGYVDQCDQCSLNSGDSKRKYLGRPGATSKSANIEIFRTDLDRVSTIIRRENACGPTANLNLPSAAQHAAMDRFKGEGDE